MITALKEILIYNKSAAFNLNSLNTNIKNKINKILRINPATGSSYQIWSPNAGVFQFSALTCDGLYIIESNSVDFNLSNDNSSDGLVKLNNYDKNICSITSTPTPTPTPTSTPTQGCCVSKLENSTAIACDNSGTKLISTFDSTNGIGGGDISISNDGGNSWTTVTSTGKQNFRYALSSDNGLVLVAVASFGYIYVSNDGGITWSQKGLAKNWSGVACSSDGAKIMAVENQEGLFYISTDSGATWVAKQPFGSVPLSSVACSSDGQKIIVAARGIFNPTIGEITTGGGYIYTSNDGGTTWTTSNNSSGVGWWWKVSCSADGTKLSAITYASTPGPQSGLYISSDGGQTWTQSRSTDKQWYTILCSSDGNILIAGTAGAVTDGYLHISYNFGTTWTELPCAGNQPDINWWTSIAMSENNKVFASNRIAVYNLSNCVFL